MPKSRSQPTGRPAKSPGGQLRADSYGRAALVVLVVTTVAVSGLMLTNPASPQQLPPVPEISGSGNMSADSPNVDHTLEGQHIVANESDGTFCAYFPRSTGKSDAYTGSYTVTDNHGVAHTYTGPMDLNVGWLGAYEGPPGSMAHPVPAPAPNPSPIPLPGPPPPPDPAMCVAGTVNTPQARYAMPGDLTRTGSVPNGNSLSCTYQSGTYWRGPADTPAGGNMHFELKGRCTVTENGVAYTGEFSERRDGTSTATPPGCGPHNQPSCAQPYWGSNPWSHSGSGHDPMERGVRSVAWVETYTARQTGCISATCTTTSTPGPGGSTPSIPTTTTTLGDGMTPTTLGDGTTTTTPGNTTTTVAGGTTTTSSTSTTSPVAVTTPTGSAPDPTTPEATVPSGDGPPQGGLGGDGGGGRGGDPDGGGGGGGRSPGSGGSNGPGSPSGGAGTGTAGSPGGSSSFTAAPPGGVGSASGITSSASSAGSASAVGSNAPGLVGSSSFVPGSVGAPGSAAAAVRGVALPAIGVAPGPSAAAEYSMVRHTTAFPPVAVAAGVGLWLGFACLMTVKTVGAFRRRPAFELAAFDSTTTTFNRDRYRGPGDGEGIW